MTRYTLGIDPGIGGALVLLSPDGALAKSLHMPVQQVKGKTTIQAQQLAHFIDLYADDIKHAYIEVVTSRPRQAGQLLIGFNAGLIHGILHAHCIRITQVSPSAWKGWFNIKRDDTQSYRDMKNVSRALASEQWPDQADLFKRVKDDGLAEAALIALYGLNTGDDK